KLTVGELQAPTEPQAAQESAPQAVEPADALGLKVADVPSAVQDKGSFKGGVQVVDVEDPAATAGIMPGDIVLTVNATDIVDSKQFASVVKKLDKSRAAALLVL